MRNPNSDHDAPLPTQATEANPWLSARQAANLPGLPSTERGIRSRARRENWLTRQVRALGGPGGIRLEFNVNSLPPEARRSWLGEAVPAVAGVAASAKPLLTLPLTPRAKARANARQHIVTAWERHLRKNHGHNVREATLHFLELFHQGWLTLPNKVILALPKVSIASLYRWRHALREQGTAALGGRYGEQRLAYLNAPETTALLRRLLAQEPQATAQRLRQYLLEQSAPRSALLPSLRQLNRWLRLHRHSLD